MPRLYQSITACVIGLLHRVGRKQGRIRHLPLARGWREARDFPAPESSTFMRQYRQSTRGQHES
jgi:L-lactate dehydrogenase complex protein LldF